MLGADSALRDSCRPRVPAANGPLGNSYAYARERSVSIFGFVVRTTNIGRPSQSAGGDARRRYRRPGRATILPRPRACVPVGDHRNDFGGFRGWVMDGEAVELGPF